ncbi:MAG: FAD-dependent thymidylate synthase [Thermoplasmata archaeon]
MVKYSEIYLDQRDAEGMDARELWHFFSPRCCRRAQWKIREMAGRMLEPCKEVFPIIFEGLLCAVPPGTLSRGRGILVRQTHG